MYAFLKLGMSNLSSLLIHVFFWLADVELSNTKYCHKNIHLYIKMESTLLSWAYCDSIQGKLEFARVCV